jgi:hypothetical protein
VLRPEKDLKEVKVQPADFTNGHGNTIPADNIRVERVGYVPVTVPTDAMGCVGDWPDPLPPWEDGVEVQSGANQPVWVTVKVPRDARVIATTQSYLSDEQVTHLARVIVYSRKEIALHEPSVRHKYTFVPLPADGDYAALSAVAPTDYIFSGGGAGRDFATLIDAVRGLDLPLRIVTFSPETLGYAGTLPANCTVEWRMGPQKFLERLAAAKFVVVPLIRGEHPHGHTTVVQALRLGKPVITTSNASVEDYVRHEKEGLLVEPGDVAGYRDAILRLENDAALWCRCREYAHRRAAELTYAEFATRVAAICREVMQDDC